MSACRPLPARSGRSRLRNEADSHSEIGLNELLGSQPLALKSCQVVNCCKTAQSPSLFQTAFPRPQ